MKFFYKNIVLEVPESVYYPEDDSLLLAEVTEKTGIKNKKILDMGSGSGFLSILTAKKGADVVACDIDGDAIEAINRNAKGNNVKIKVLQSDLFSTIKEKFDLIIFNPPYLPENEFSRDKRAYSGGRTGREVIEKFAKEAENHLNPGGKILMVFSSLAGEKQVIKTLKNLGFKSKILKRKKIPWEELLVLLCYF